MAGKVDWQVVRMGLLVGRLVVDYPDHRGTYCAVRGGPLQAGSRSSGDTEDLITSTQ